MLKFSVIIKIYINQIQINFALLSTAFKNLFDSDWAEEVIIPLKIGVELCFKIELLVNLQSDYPQRQ